MRLGGLGFRRLIIFGRFGLGMRSVRAGRARRRLRSNAGASKKESLRRAHSRLVSGYSTGEAGAGTGCVLTAATQVLENSAPDASSESNNINRNGQSPFQIASGREDYAPALIES